MSKRSGLWQSLMIQKRVIFALIMREVLTRYGRSNIGFLWLFLETTLFVGAVTFVWNLSKGLHGFKLPITAFAVTGYSSILLWRNMVNRCSGAMSPNIGLLFHRNVRVLDVFIARICLELIGATISFVVLTVFFVSIGTMEPPVDILYVVLGWGLLAWFGASFALIVGCLSEKFEIVDRIWRPISYLMLPISGAGFMVDWLSPGLRDLALALPMVHGVEILREGYFGAAAKSHYDMGYMAFFCLCMTYVGLRYSQVIAREINLS